MCGAVGTADNRRLGVRVSSPAIGRLYSDP